MRRLLPCLLLLALSAPLSAQILYWEDPQVLVADGARFPQAASGGGLVAVVWQEFEANRIWLSLRTSRDLVRWTERRRFAGPLAYQGEQAPLFSLEVDDQGRLYVAIASSDRQTTVMYSSDAGARFVSTTVQAPVTTVGPRLALRADGSLYLFVVYDARESSSLGIYYVVLDAVVLAEGGVLRRPLRPVAAEQKLLFNFLPSHAALGGRDYVVYQSQDNSGGRTTFQLWLRISDLAGGFAAPPIALTASRERVDGADLGPEMFDNQRPHLLALDDRLAVVWERRQASGPKQVYYMELSPEGVILRPAGVAGQPYVRVTENAFECLFPQVFRFRGRLYVMWFDNRRGEQHVFVAERDGQLWRERDLSSRLGGSSIYPWFVESESGMAVLWENQQANRSRLAMGGPDQSADPPQILPQGFTPGLPSRASRVALAWSVPADSSGISGFSWSWSQDPAASPERRLMAPVENTRTVLEAARDGKWYFSVAALDFAGNWSRPATLVYDRDTQPPPPVTFEPQKLDDKGFLAASNSPRIQWKSGDGDPVSGYTYDMFRLSADPEAAQPAAPPRATLAPQVRSQLGARPYENLDNGLWVFSAAAVDLAGNVGEAALLYLRLNKYVPVTLITSVDSVKDQVGHVRLSILGRGFAEDGRITQVVLDRDGKEPWDYTYGQADFRLASDRFIEGIGLTRYDEGSYRVGLLHSKRGLTLTPPVLSLDAYGTVKLGDFAAASYTPPWEAGTRPAYTLAADRLLVWLLVAFMAFAVLASANRVVAVTREARDLREQVFAVVSGAAVGKEELMRELKSKGMSLRVKFTLLIAVLVILIVLMVSVPLSINMVGTQTRNLAQGLEQRVRVLLGSISAAAGPFLIDQMPTELAGLANQINAMPDAQYATITGITPRDSDRPGGGEEYVWATNDGEIEGKIGGGDLQAGLSVLKDEVSPAVGELAARINGRAVTEIGGLVQELERQLLELQPLYGKTDEGSKARFEQLSKSTAGLQTRIDRQLRGIGGEYASVPEFRYEQLGSRYLFYQPIVFRVRGSDIYFRGLVRLSVSASSILKEIQDTTRSLYSTIGIIALVAIGLGTLGALILASITIGPIRRLAEGVARIRDTEDKEELKDHRIEIRQKDEIRTLADTINEMTQGLVKAAIASKELTVGKEIQKMFLPLSLDSSGRKGTTGYESDNAVEIFGYYEGAKGVSGDYFDYRRLDGEHYALIKCDVSGKGVPAALIMVEVATIFQTYFKNWTPQSPGMRIDRFAYAVNDQLEERGFKGRFATLMVALVNIRTGVCVMVNAGDNIVHFYSAGERRMVTKQHPNPPAAGVFPSVLLEAQAGFKPVAERLERGDTLFLITDGMEEAQRLFRGRDFQPLSLEQDETIEGDGETVTLTKGSAFEQLGITRIQRIVAAVFNRGTYQLRKHHDPTPDEQYVFDFTSCRTTVEEAVLAMIAVEKVFRLYLDPSAGPGDTVTVDGKIDAFLKEHFRQYSLYFGHPLERSDDPGHTAYSHLKEDSQYDDLTILAIRRK